MKLKPIFFMLIVSFAISGNFANDFANAQEPIPALEEPNIALEQALEQQLKLNSAANFDEVNNAKQENQERWNKAMSEFEEGKMFTTNCNELTGVCEYKWVDPPHYILLTNERTGENMTVPVYCKSDETWNEEDIVCENKNKLLQISASLLILFSITIAGVILGSWRIYKKRKLTSQFHESETLR